MTAAPESSKGTEEKAKRPPRPHPYADEASTEAELRHDPKRITIFWLVGSTLLAAGGLILSTLLSPYVNGAHHSLDAKWYSLWDNGTVVVLMVGLLMLGLRAWLPDKKWTHDLAIPGWTLFGLFWALTARDLFVNEGSDYVNSTAAVLATYASTYFAYHEWLNKVREVPNLALHFLRKTMVVAAGAYFAISYIVPLRIGLIKVVGAQTNWVLNNIFGTDQPVHFELREAYTERLGPVSFWYDDTKGLCPDGTEPVPVPGEAPCLGAYEGVGNWLQDFLFYIPASEHMEGTFGLKILMVSIILACTAIQSIMLFVGMFVGTPGAPWRKKLWYSLGVGAVIYALNLIRNAGVIFLYGRGHTSFWFIHNLVAKVVTLGVLIGIAYVCFRGFPEFFRALGTVLDLPQRDGPIERTLRLGKKRPEATAASAPSIAPAMPSPLSDESE